jgi:hypothetical protein
MGKVQVIYWGEWCGVWVRRWDGPLASLFNFSVMFLFWEFRVWKPGQYPLKLSDLPSKSGRDEA